MRVKLYNRNECVLYAKKWAMQRNPKYLNFDGMGGDCTNFASQCLYMGSGVMNYTKDVGWYYITSNNRAAAWTDAQYLNNFLLKNNSAGPFAEKRELSELYAGDLIQLSDGNEIYHTLVISGSSGKDVLVCAHTEDSFMRPISTYSAKEYIGIHINGVNII